MHARRPASWWPTRPPVQCPTHLTLHMCRTEQVTVTRAAWAVHAAQHNRHEPRVPTGGSTALLRQLDLLLWCPGDKHGVRERLQAEDKRQRAFLALGTAHNCWILTSAYCAIHAPQRVQWQGCAFAGLGGSPLLFTLRIRMGRSSQKAWGRSCKLRHQARLPHPGPASQQRPHHAATNMHMARGAVLQEVPYGERCAASLYTRY
jgi:hypothetical protein